VRLILQYELVGVYYTNGQIYGGGTAGARGRGAQGTAGEPSIVAHIAA